LVQGGLSDRTTRYYFKQLLSGLHAIHTRGFAHRDLKPENILFNENFSLKLADFGFARRQEGDNFDGLLHTTLGSRGY